MKKYNGGSDIMIPQADKNKHSKSNEIDYIILCAVYKYKGMQIEHPLSIFFFELLSSGDLGEWMA